MQLPNLEVIFATEEKVPFSSVYGDGPVALVFLRHLGCIFCHEQVAQLHDGKKRNLILVGKSEPQKTREYIEEFKVEYPVICDPEGVLYQAFGLERAALSQVFGPKVIARGAQAWQQGFRPRKPASDPMQLGGTFVLSSTGELLYENRSRDASEYTPLSTIDAYLAQ